MQMDEAARLREKSGRPCKNPNYEKEYYAGADTGDRVCRNCGYYDFNHTDTDEDE